ncbi:hypothetical protein KSP40_PGU012219 [Platanthera guangdongensis]|uniref:Uncharacterized protein n=1 Tax=Platanthera guangdongensis TaxID=2320717 RepID=A0ABR2MLW7_9ASPA
MLYHQLSHFRLFAMYHLTIGPPFIALNRSRSITGPGEGEYIGENSSALHLLHQIKSHYRFPILVIGSNQNVPAEMRGDDRTLGYFIPYMEKMEEFACHGQLSTLGIQVEYKITDIALLQKPNRTDFGKQEDVRIDAFSNHSMEEMLNFFPLVLPAIATDHGGPGEQISLWHYVKHVAGVFELVSVHADELGVDERAGVFHGWEEWMRRPSSSELESMLAWRSRRLSCETDEHSSEWGCRDDLLRGSSGEAHGRDGALLVRRDGTGETIPTSSFLAQRGLPARITAGLVGIYVQCPAAASSPPDALGRIRRASPVLDASGGLRCRTRHSRAPEAKLLRFGLRGPRHRTTSRHPPPTVARARLILLLACSIGHHVNNSATSGHQPAATLQETRAHSMQRHPRALPLHEAASASRSTSRKLGHLHKAPAPPSKLPEQLTKHSRPPPQPCNVITTPCKQPDFQQTPPPRTASPRLPHPSSRPWFRLLPITCTWSTLNPQLSYSLTAQQQLGSAVRRLPHSPTVVLLRHFHFRKPLASNDDSKCASN